MPDNLPKNLLRFGGFELDRVGNELRKHGHKIKIQDQPLCALVLLLENHGRVITRNEFHNVLWRNGVFVDFDHGLNRIIHRLRQVLEDSAEDPQFIRTVGRGKGYQFVMPVEAIHSPDGDRRNVILGRLEKQRTAPTRDINGEKPIAVRMRTYVTPRSVELGLVWAMLTVVALTDAIAEIAMGQWNGEIHVSYLLDGLVAGGVAASMMDVFFRHSMRVLGTNSVLE
jgi:DNA-binding winged helix-turn-helix (wHTH) protein